jgi:hypothetical protein
MLIKNIIPHIETMKRFYFIILVCVITLSSCVKDDDSLSQKEMQVTLNGCIEDNQTKIAYVPTEDSTSFHFIWSANDKVSIIINDNSSYNTNNEFLVTKADIYSPIYGTVTKWESKRNLFAVYPFNNNGYEIVEHVEDPELVISADSQQISVGNGSDRIKNGLMVAYLKSVECDSLINQTLNFEQTMCFIKLSVIDIPATEHITAVGLEDETSSKIPIKWSFRIWSSEYQSLPDSTSSQLYVTVQKSLPGIPTIITFALIPFNYGDPNIGGTGRLSIYVETTNRQGSVKSYMIKDLERMNFVRNIMYEMSASLKGLTGIPVTANHQR